MENNSEHAIAKQLLTTFDGPYHAMTFVAFCRT